MKKQNEKNGHIKNVSWVIILLATILCVMLPTLAFAMGALQGVSGFGSVLFSICSFFHPAIFLLILGTGVLYASWYCMKNCLPKTGWRLQ